MRDRALLASCWLALACMPEGEVKIVTVTAHASGAHEGAWGDELKPGMKVIAVSPDLVEHGMVRGSRVRIEGFPGGYSVMDRLDTESREHIRVYVGEDADAARRWGEHKVQIYWEKP